MTTSDSKLHESDAALERLLEEASPRPAPSAEAVARARLAVHDEWQQLVRHRTRRRRVGFLAAAATVVLAVAIGMNTVFVPRPAAVEVATVDRATGAVYILGEESILERTEGLTSFTTGQTIFTGDSAIVGLRWGEGGSLRVNERTEISFVSPERVELESGQVYFDSVSPSGEEVALTIGTPHGDVRHLGTQFLVTVDQETLIVRVREGRVDVDGRLHDDFAIEGQMLQIRGSESPQKTNTTRYGIHWEWIEAAGPVVTMEGRTLGEFLAWVERETGLEVIFQDSELEADVIDDPMYGEVRDAPRDALRQRLRTYDLRFEEFNGQLFIRPADP
ncbi:MAG: FecR family protein [Woeseiaceae bacterium]|nr:FecR family protein [Woeseiaceae bacterium]